MIHLKDTAKQSAAMPNYLTPSLWHMELFHFPRHIAVQGIPIVVYSILRANVLYTIHAVRVLRARRPELVG